MSDTKDKVVDLLNHGKAKEKGYKFRDNTGLQITGGIKLTQRGHNKGNVHIGGNNTYKTTSPPKINYLPPTGTIGNDARLKERIKTLFNKIGEEREKRFGKNAYSVMYRTFKKDFGIRNVPWTVIWEWPIECAAEIISYLEGKFDNTIQGRIRKAAQREDHLPARPLLYEQEKQLLDHFGLKTKSPEVKDALQKMFGVTSHSRLNWNQHWIFVKNLESQVKKLYGEE